MTRLRRNPELLLAAACCAVLALTVLTIRVAAG
jgi:hypothetical protein